MSGYPNEASYKLKVSITYKYDKMDEYGTEDDVLCEIFLPDKVADPIQLRLKPTPDQARALQNIFMLSIYSEIKDANGEVGTQISGKTIYNLGTSTRHWGAEISEAVLFADPADLTVTHFFHDSQDATVPTLVFWLTPCIILPIRKFLIHRYNGITTLEASHTFPFILGNGLQLTFDHYYRYLTKEPDVTESFPELVAACEIDSTKPDMEMSLAALDDFLMLTSFAARQRCICLGWEARDASHWTRFFRRDISIPKHDKKYSLNDTLIDMADYEQFITAAYANFNSSQSKELISQALYGAIDRSHTSINSRFLTLYASLEALVNHHRKANGMEIVLPGSSWQEFESDIKRFIKTHRHFEAKKERRILVYDKLKELNRISFGVAFDSFSRHYDVSLNDLWPVVDRKNGISLADIRNKLIHGATFNKLQEQALSSATSHLRWIVERSILAVLGWPREESKVSVHSLSIDMAWQRNWQDDRHILTQSK